MVVADQRRRDGLGDGIVISISPTIEIDDLPPGRHEEHEAAHLENALNRLQVLIGEIESDTVGTDGRPCWIELDAAIRSLHASATSLSEAVQECQLAG